MSKTIGIIILLIGLSIFKTMAQMKDSLLDNINGDWEYEKVTINKKEFNASELNECGYKDIVKIHRNLEIEEYRFDSIKIKGNPIGVSNTKICSVNPIDYKNIVINNSCYTKWLMLIDTPNRILSISEEGVIEYEIEVPNRRSITLVKVKEITNHDSKQPEKIKLRKID